MPRRAPRIAALTLLSAVMLSCGGSGELRSERLVLTGSSTVAPLASELARRFEALRPGARIDVQTGGSSRGIADARDGMAHIGMVSRALAAGEQDLLAVTVARDGIAMITHASNPVRALSSKQVAAIYTGEVADWSEVGGSAGPITVVHKAAGRSTLELFVQHFGLDETAVRPHVVIGDNEQGVKTVAGNPGAIGYVSIGTAEYDSGHGVPVRLLALDGVPASTASVADGSFPLARPLNLVTRGEPEGLAAEFLEFARSRAAHDLVRAQHFVPIVDERRAGQDG